MRTNLLAAGTDDLLFLAVLVQGVGSLILALVGVTLFTYRRRTSFLLWTCAWVCLGAWLLTITLQLGGTNQPLPLGGWHPVLRAIGAIAALWHIALWGLGLFAFRREQMPPEDRPARARAFLSPAVILLGSAAVALVVSGTLSWVAANLLLAIAAAVVYGWSAAVFYTVSRLPGRYLAALPAASAACSALERLNYVLVYGAMLAAPSWRPDFLGYLTCVDFLLQTFLGLSLVVLLLDEEKAVLRDALQRLAESEDRFRLLFERSGVGMALLSPEGMLLQANPALARFLGRTAEELRGRKLSEFAHPDEATTSSPTLTQASALDSAVYEREKRYVHASGQTLWARVLRVPVRDAQDRLRYHVGVLLDITESKKTERALQLSEQLYRLRFQTAFDGIAIWARDGTFLDANPALCRMLSTTREELMKCKAADVADDPARLSHELLHAPEQGGGTLQTRLRRRTGELLDVEMSFGSMQLNGQPMVHASCSDVTDRRRAEQILREERDFSQQVLDTADALVVVLDPAGRVLRFNAKCSRVTGYSEPEVRSRVFWEALVPERLSTTVREQMQRLAAERLPLICEHPCLTRDGRERLIAWRNAALVDAAGRLRCVIAIGLDVTDQRRLEEQLRQTTKMEVLGSLVGGIAHDFNNHLTAVLGNIQLTRNKLQDEAAIGFLQIADQAARRCATMTERLLAFSGQRVGRTQRLQVNELVSEAVRLLQHVLPSNIRVDPRLDPHLREVQADGTQLHQVIMNMAVNARDALPEGGTLTVRTANRTFEPDAIPEALGARSGQFVELTIRDDGVGMSPEVQARIFEPFFTTKGIGQGTGLGLPMAFGIVRSHEGWIEVTSAPGQGTEFRIYLPAASATMLPANPPAPGPEAAISEVATQGANKVVLVVDDEAMIRTLVHSVLEQAGYRVLLAADGAEALKVYREHMEAQGPSAIDLVLLDYTMPNLTGVQVLERLRQINPSVRVILSSGYAIDSNADRMLAAGACAFMAKPYRVQELLQAVSESMATH